VFLLFCVFDVYVICILYVICFICVKFYLCVVLVQLPPGENPNRSLKLIIIIIIRDNWEVTGNCRE
jgi:hypothetical protein